MAFELSVGHFIFLVPCYSLNCSVNLLPRHLIYPFQTKGIKKKSFLFLHYCPLLIRFLQYFVLSYIFFLYLFFFTSLSTLLSCVPLFRSASHLLSLSSLLSPSSPLPPHLLLQCPDLHSCTFRVWKGLSSAACSSICTLFI